jgi:hypothetical protein
MGENGNRLRGIDNFMITCSLNVEKQGLDCCSHHNCPDAKPDNKPDILVLCRHFHPDSFLSVYVLELTKLKKTAVYTPRSSTRELQYEESFFVRSVLFTENSNL